MTLAHALSVTKREYIQETLDLYTNDNRRVTILKPQDYGKRVIYMKEKYDDLGNSWLEAHPYINIIINLQKQEYTTR